MSVEDRFWPKVDKSDPGGCWLWTAAKGKGGYGNFGVTPRKTAYAHRFAYELMVGAIPEGLQLDHLCRNKACVNPAHLEPVTCKENLERGVNVGAAGARLQREKTHCAHGHEFTPENTHRYRGQRVCRECSRINAREYGRKKRRAMA